MDTSHTQMQCKREKKKHTLCLYVYISEEHTMEPIFSEWIFFKKIHRFRRYFDAFAFIQYLNIGSC